MWFIVKNLMLFDHFEAILRFGLQNDQNSIGFIRYFDMAECHVIYSEKPNAFSFWRPFWVLGSKMIKIEQVL